jgi:ABC-type glycerol-3-phosphate transport system permease component
MPIWLFSILVGATDFFSGLMFLQIEALAGAAVFSESGAALALLYGAFGSYILARLRFYGSHQAHLRNVDMGTMYPYLVAFQMVFLKFFELKNGWLPLWKPSADLQNPIHVCFMVMFLISVYGMTVTAGRPQ